MYNFEKNLRKNQSGQGLLMAIVVTLGVGVAVGTLLTNSQNTDKLLKAPRIRSAMMAVHQRVKLLSMNPAAFNCTGSAAAPTCSLRNSTPTEPFHSDQLNIDIPGAACAVASCGVRVTLSFNQTNRQITGVVSYDGTDLNFQNTNFTVEVPPEVLQVSSSDCKVIDATRPIFVGYDSDGKIMCRAIGGETCSDPGEFVRAINKDTLELTCGQFPSAPVGCGPNQYITSLTWDGTEFDVTCANRLDPFVKFAFLPSVTTSGAPTAPAPGPNPKNTCAPIPTTTTTTTTTTTLPGPTTTTLPGPPPPPPPPTTTTLPPGAGVTACLPGPWINNTCDMSKTGQPCPTPDFNTIDEGGGGVSPETGAPGDPGYIKGIGLKCVPVWYCSTIPMQCQL